LTIKKILNISFNQYQVAWDAKKMKQAEIVKILKEEERLGTLKQTKNLQILEDISIEKNNTSINNNQKKPNDTKEIEHLDAYKTIFENYQIALTLADKNEHIISWNKYTEMLFNMTEQELYKKPVHELYPVKEWNKIRAENIRKKGIKYQMQTKMLKKNNEAFDVELSLCILKGAGGHSVGSIGIIKDISALKQTEKKLQESEKKYKLIFENSAVAITLTDENEKIISWNCYADKLLGTEKNDLYGKPVSSLYPKKEWEKIRKQNIRQKGMQHHLETKILKKNNELLDVDISLSVLKDDTGKINGSIGVIRDISNRKKIERLLNQVMEHAGDSIYVLDKNYKYILVNNELLKRTNKTEDNLIGKSITDLYKEKEADEFIKKINEVFKTKKSLKDEHQKNNKWFLRTISPIQDNVSNEISAVLIISKDITEIKKTQEIVLQSEKKFRLVLENSIDMIYQINIQKQTYEYVSPSSKKVLGYTPEEIISFGITKMNRLIHPNEIATIFNKNKNLIHNTQEKEFIQHLEYRFNHKQMGYRWVSDIRSISYKKNNEPISIIGTIKDITDRKKVWDEMVKSEEKYRVLAETSADGVFTTDVLGRLTYVNPSLEKLMGRRKSKILATPFKNYLSESSVYSFQQIIIDIRKSNQKMENVELSLLHQNGYNIPIEINIAPLKKEDTFVGIECTVRDISERESVVRELKKSEKLRTEFMNIAAHELKSPVTPIKGYLELIESDKDVDEKIKKWARIGLRNADRLLLLVNDILDVSRLDTDTMRFNMEKINVNEVLENALEDIKPSIENKNLKLIKNFNEDLPKIFGDKYRLSQVLKNLLGNAVKFTDYGSITLNACTKNKCVLISIEDTGIGISKDELDKIFTKLYQAYTGEDRKNEGAGLGLYICKEIIHKHNGKIWAHSEIGKGSTFSIEIPF
jgi:PAS domain S-box-containing protein